MCVCVCLYKCLFVFICILYFHCFPGTTSVTIYVADTNDKSPVFVFPRSGNNTIIWSPTLETQSTQNSHFVTRVSAIDNDLGDNSLLSYELELPDTFAVNDITIDPSTGAIYIKNSFWGSTAGTGALYTGILTLVVKALDHGYPQIFTRQLLNVELRSSEYLVYDGETDRNQNTRTTKATVSSAVLDKKDATLIVALTASALFIVFIILFAIMVFLIYRRATSKDPVDRFCCLFKDDTEATLSENTETNYSTNSVKRKSDVENPNRDNHIYQQNIIIQTKECEEHNRKQLPTSNMETYGNRTSDVPINFQKVNTYIHTHMYNIYQYI